MKYTFQYRTGDNILHNGTINAADKDAAFAALRARGIKPSRLAEAPGFLNALFGKGKRWLAIGALVALVIGLLIALRTTKEELAAIASPEERAERHQIYGDPVILSELMADGFAGVFATDAERFLACYAMPGATMATPVRLKSPNDLAACLTNKIAFAQDDAREVTELKAIVNGIKEELQAYLADGEGTCASFMRRLEERQEEERLIYRRVQNELEENPDPALWKERNKALREMGIRTVPRPREEKK